MNLVNKSIFSSLILIFILSVFSCSGVEVVNTELGTGSKEEVARKTVEAPKKEIAKKESILDESKFTDHSHKNEFTTVTNTKTVSTYCDKIDKRFKKYGWGKSHCDSYKWIHVRDSHLGQPIMWTVFGDEVEHREKPKNMTLVLCGVHGDEITPIKFCFDILHHLYHEVATVEGQKKLKDNLVAVAPIVSPDSFFKRRPTRTNARGIDPNRNFPTKDWDKKALKLWKTRYRAAKRRFPGYKSNSEQETIFQVNIIARYNPDKIITVHAPLTILDYDGPVVSNHVHDEDGLALKAEELLNVMSKKANGYRVKNYPFFPGSLGNYAGNERKIPTYTLELPSSDNRNHKKYWKMFRESIDFALFHAPMTRGEIAANKNEEN